MPGRKNFKNFIKNPGVWLWAFWAALALFAAAAAICALILGVLHPAACVFYAVCLALSVYCISASVRPVRALITRCINSNRLLSHMAADYGYRTVAFSVVSLAISTAYAVYQGVLGLIFLSAWYGLFSGYYLVLSVLRAVIIFRARKSEGEAGDLKIYLICGVMFIVLSVVLAVLVTFLIYSGNDSHNSVIGAISMAAYAFYKIIAAAVNAVKNRKYGSFALQSLRNISFADALLSVFALQIAMVATFGGGENMGTLNIITGAAVFLITLGMGIYMIARSARGLYKLKDAGDVQGVRQNMPQSGGKSPAEENDGR